MSEHGVIPSTGSLGENWPANHVLTQGKGGSLSSAGWTEGNEGFPQQTFLGASIRSFNISAGFGDSTSSLSVELVNDEFNTSDSTKLGEGDDPYHGGTEDVFRPPVVGTPVYFKFGKNHADIEQAYRKTFDDLYGKSTIPSESSFPTYTTTGEITSVPAGHYLRSSEGTGDSKTNTWVNKSSLSDKTNKARGKDHFAFGGILQSYTQNQGPQGNPLYTVQVSDPREILTNAVVLFNNYQGTTYNNKNLFNVYGFLEYDVSDSLKSVMEFSSLSKSVLTKQVDDLGNIAYLGDDTYNFGPTPFALTSLPPIFPITGQGFSRRSDKGIPWYRVNQGLAALFNYKGAMPQEYVDAGFGGTIDFRGYKYVVDFSGIPMHLIPKMYYMDFDQLDMLSIAQELCDIISHELYVTLLPVIDHPGCQFLYDLNNHWISQKQPQNIITGIIRIDAIDKTRPPKYGAIKSYLDELSARGVAAENQDVGFELSNVTTDKFVVGAQEIDMYYFSGNKDRDNLQLRKKNAGESNALEMLESAQWSLDTSLKQQILPFYGFLGEKAVTIPRGFGSYQQIMLDASALDAHGVGNYYIATELELRAAQLSYEQWKNFLLQYNEVYIQELTQNQGFYGSLSSQISDVVSGLNDQLSDSPTVRAHIDQLLNRDFGVSVPRCVFNSDKDYMGTDGYPASPCAPPYGYPLYYKRAEKIGIPEAGVVSIQQAITTSLSNIENAKKYHDTADSYYKVELDNLFKQINTIKKEITAQIHKSGHTDEEGVLEEDWRDKFQENNRKLFQALKDAEEYRKDLELEMKTLRNRGEALIPATKNNLEGNKGLVKNVSRYAKQHLKNAKKVYAFVKKVADENLGKKFLVQIPKSCNLNYDKQIAGNSITKEVHKGPFGFEPSPVNADAQFPGSQSFEDEIRGLVNVPTLSMGGSSLFEPFLDINSPQKYTYGALKCNFNPITEKWEYNYKPEPQGGFFNFALYNKNLSAVESTSMPASQLPPGTQQMLAPMDLGNLINNGNRISCYARYDNSQFLDFHGVGKKDLTQQKISPGGFIPDIMEELPNMAPDKSLALDQIQARLTNDKSLERQGPSVAYVKCSIDEDLYMPPKTMGVMSTVWARNYTVNIPAPQPEIIKERDEEGCLVPKMVKRRLVPSFAVPPGGGADGTTASNTDFLRYYDDNVKGQIVDTRLINLDSNHVYALLTVPGKISPSVDSRYLDGPLHSFNTVKLKNILTQDVIRGVDGFDLPAPITNGTKEINCETVDFSFKAISEALQAQRDVVKGVSLSSPGGKLAFTSPSPVYPDLVAIPLMSMERCYGPWLSVSSINPEEDSRVRYSNIGGKIEFVKDENLAPWNFAGFQLMNEAGYLQAQFSNSLLLFSERGGFVFPDAPTGIALAKVLKDEGPLITSISVDVGASIRTTVKMDLYTSSFGKLAKQKEGAIASIARERQKIIDQNNNAIRRGLGKAASNNNLMGGLLANGGQQIIDAAKGGQDFFEDIETQKAERANVISFSAVTEDYQTISEEQEEAVKRVKKGYETAIGTANQLRAMAGFSQDGIAADKANQDTAGGPLPVGPACLDVLHNVFPTPGIVGALGSQAKRLLNRAATKDRQGY